MGGAWSSAQRLLGMRRRDRAFLMLGLYNAGKTTILHRLELGAIVTTMPTIGFNVETVEHKSRSLVSFTVWDVGGRDGIRMLWRHWYVGKDALIFVVDSSDEESLEQSHQQLWKMLGEEELRGRPLLVLANKQDLPKALAPAQLAERLGLHSLRGRLWDIQGCCATAGDGLFEGLDWLSTVVRDGQLSAVEAKHRTVAGQRPPAKGAAPAEGAAAGDAAKGYGDPGGSAADTESTADTDLPEEEVGRAEVLAS